MAEVGTPALSGGNKAWQPSFNPWLIAVAVMLGTFMEILDTSIVNVSLPHIAGTMAATPEEATWTITSYLVANAVVLPLTGWLGATFGRKRFFLLCVLLFTASSLWSGSATTLSMLILARIFQGLGGGAMQPTAQAVLLESFPPQQRGTAMAFYGLGVVVAPILGPIVGGYITDNYSWRWAFYINLPVGLLAFALSAILLEDPPYLRAGRTSKVDYVGFFSLAIWVGALQVVLDKGQQEDWFSSSLIITLSVVFLLGWMFFLNWETSVDEPIVDLRIFRDRNFAVATFLITVVGLILYGSVILLPLFLQKLLGFPSFNAGLAVAPRGVGAMLAMVIVGNLLSRYDGRYFVALGFCLLGSSNLWLSHLSLQIGALDVLLPNIVQGIGLGFIFVPLTTLANSSLPVEKIGMGSGIYNLMRNIGAGVGTALATTSLSRGLQIWHNRMVGHISPWESAYPHFIHGASHLLHGLSGNTYTLALAFQELERQAALLAYIHTFQWLGWVCFLCVPLVFMMRKAVGHVHLPGH